MLVTKPYKPLELVAVIIHLILRNQQLNAHRRGHDADRCHRSSGHYFGVYHRFEVPINLGLTPFLSTSKQTKRKKEKENENEKG